MTFYVIWIEGDAKGENAKGGANKTTLESLSRVETERYAHDWAKAAVYVYHEKVEKERTVFANVLDPRERP